MSGRPEHSLPAAYFRKKYAADPDPWRFASSPYETTKYEATLAALPRTRYRHVLEIGCSIGVLTERLADRAGRVTAIDVAEEALGQARRRCAALDHVGFACGAVPGDFPEGSFDLVVMSEVGYYLSRNDLLRTVERIAGATPRGGHLLLVHWTPEATDYPLTGDQVHEIVLAAAAARFTLREGRREPTYRLDLLERSAA